LLQDVNQVRLRQKRCRQKGKHDANQDEAHQGA
jgi:hypothetical protein